MKNANLLATGFTLLILCAEGSIADQSKEVVTQEMGVEADAKNAEESKKAEQPLITGFEGSVLSESQIEMLKKERITGAFHLNARLGSRTDFFSQDEKSSPNFGLSLYAEKLFVFADLFGDVDFGQVVYGGNNDSSRTVDLSTADSASMKLGLYVPFFANQLADGSGTERMFSEKKEFRTGLVGQHSYSINNDSDPNIRNARSQSGIGVRFAIQHNGFIQIMQGRTEGLVGKRIIADLSMPIMTWNQSAKLILLAQADFSASDSNDDVFRFGFDVQIPVVQLGTLLKPILPSF